MEERKVIKIKLRTAIILILAFILIITVVTMLIISGNRSSKPLSCIKNVETNKSEKQHSENIKIVATLEDEITTNSAWCGTLQLVWNDMLNNVVKQDVVFTPQKQIVENLNKQIFTEEQLSEEDYYKVYDLLTQNLKEEIEKAIESKFNEESDILNKIDWSNVPKDNSGYTDEYKKYLFYAMLKKEFNFKNDFDELENGSFGEKYKDIKYFGIDKKSNSKLYSQVEVLYYNSENDFAVILNTKEDEQVILCRGTEGNNFATIYNSLVEKSDNYRGNKKFTENDYLKVPNIKFDISKSFNELCDNKFYSKDGHKCNIEQVLQTIQVEMDKSGGKIKSEAAIIMEVSTMMPAKEKVEYRYFYFNDEFTMFFKEADKEMPYFAANIKDITLFQE